MDCVIVFDEEMGAEGVHRWTAYRTKPGEGCRRINCPGYTEYVWFGTVDAFLGIWGPAYLPPSSLVAVTWTTEDAGE